MADTPKKKNWVKWLVIAVVIIVVIIFLWMMFKGSASAGNKYASAETIKKVKAGTYAKWKDAWNTDAITKLNELIPGTYSSGISNGDAYGRAWLKGMDVEPTLANVNEFATDIANYSKASFKKAHWEVTTGSFVNETAQA